MINPEITCVEDLSEAQIKLFGIEEEKEVVLKP
jgi:hypothetical protein